MQHNREFTIGQAVQFGDAVGYIAKIEDNDGGGCSHVIGAHGMQEIKQRIRIVFTGANPHVSEDVAEQQAEHWANRAAHLPNVSPDAIPDLIEAAELAQQEKRDAARNDRSEQERARAEFVEKYSSKVPDWAKGVIVAHKHVSESDPMSDYHGHRVEESIILGFSKHERNLFPELRKAAANAEETQHLATKPTCPPGRDEFWTPEDEHRENYSMGGGTYLGVYKDSSGWTVKKHTMYSDDKDLMTRIPVGRWAVADTKKPAPRTAPRATTSTADGAGIEEHYHTKRGVNVFMVVPSQRVDREEYIRLLAEAKKLGGWYSRAWSGTPGGYAFKDHETAARFLAEQYGDPQAVGRATRDTSTKPAPCQAQKFRALADTMQLKIDDKLSDRQENTPKRQAQAAHARLEGRRLERTQAALRALANLHEAGEVPEILAGLKNRAGIHEHMGSKLQSVPNGFHEYKIETGEPHSEDPIAVALWALLDAPDPEKVAAEELAQKIRNLQGTKIPGFFPTPDPVIDYMLELAGIDHGDHTGTKVLEPELGSCAIADRVAETGATVVGYEINHALAEICEAKGYLLKQADFMKCEDRPFNRPYNFDLVMMNPPFENSQDSDHVMHAFRFLKPGGRLVSVMSPGPFFRNDKKAQAFRAFFERNEGMKYELPEGSFKASGTGVGTVLVVIEAPE